MMNPFMPRLPRLPIPFEGNMPFPFKGGQMPFQGMPRPQMPMMRSGIGQMPRIPPLPRIPGGFGGFRGLRPY